MDFEEFEEEEAPDHLKNKWDSEAYEVIGSVPCPHCGQPIEKQSFACLFCGERVFENSGLLGQLAVWFKNGGAFWVLFAVAAFLAVTLFF